MWILPSNHPLYSHFAQECVGLNLESNEVSASLTRSLMWKSKPLSSKIWFSKWKRVYWIQHLFGRTLKPSCQSQKDFVERWTSLLPDTHASRLVWPEPEPGKKIPDICGPTSKTSLMQLDLFAVSSKTSPVIYPLAMTKSERIYMKLVIRLKKEYSARKKLARRTFEKDCSLWQSPRVTEIPEQYETWLKRMRESKHAKNRGKTNASNLTMQVTKWKTPGASECEGGTMKELTGDANYKLRDQVNWTTPVATDSNRSVKYEQGGTALSLQVKMNWPTPNTMDQMPPKTEKALKKEMEVFRPGRILPGNLRDAVNWPTAQARDWNGSKSNEHGKNSRPLNEVVELVGQQSPVKHNTNGKNHVLNPAWVLQLMGTTIAKTFFEWQEMPLSRKSPN